MAVEIRPFEERYLDETLALMRKWSPDHPELGERSLYDWQDCSRYLALAGDRVVGHIGQIAHEYQYADRRPAVRLGWGITLVLDMSDDEIRKAAGRGLLHACETAAGVKYAAVGVVPAIEPAYRRRGHQIRRDSSSYFARFFRPAKALRYWNRSGAWRIPLTLANAVVRPRTRTGRYGTLEAITAFRPEWDHIWARLMQEQYDLFGRRDAKFLNHKLAQPNRQYFSHIHRDATGTVDGYIVYRRARHRVKDMDLVKICSFVGSRTAKRDMFAQAMRYATGEARGTYGIVGLSADTDAPEFRWVGMYVTQPYPVVLAAGVEGRIRVDFFDSDLDNLW
jgi:hypothetical protein